MPARRLGMKSGASGRAVNLYIASRVSGSRIENICKKIVPFLIVEIIFVILISNFPQIITWLPELIG